MSDEELDISCAFNKTPGQSRKRNASKEDSKEEDEVLPVYGKLGTPMVRIPDVDEWNEWKQKEWKKYLASKWDLTVGELPEKSDTSHLPDRRVHRTNIRKANEHVRDNLETINELNFNVGRGKAINIQYNGKDLPKKQSKKFAAAVEKALKQMGNPTMEQMLDATMDQKTASEEADFSEKFAKVGADAKLKMRHVTAFEKAHSFDPWEEYVTEMGDRNDDDGNDGNEYEGGNRDEKRYKKWLLRKIDENAVSENYNAYQLELLEMDKNGLTKKPKSLKSMVKNVQNFYRNLRRSK